MTTPRTRSTFVCATKASRFLSMSMGSPRAAPGALPGFVVQRGHVCHARVHDRRGDPRSHPIASGLSPCNDCYPQCKSCNHGLLQQRNTEVPPDRSKNAPERTRDEGSQSSSRAAKTAGGSWSPAVGGRRRPWLGQEQALAHRERLAEVHP